MTHPVHKRIRDDPPYAATAAVVNQVLVRLFPRYITSDATRSGHAIRVYWFMLPQDDITASCEREMSR